MDAGILQNVPWFLLLLALLGGGFIGLRLGVRFHATLANVPLIGVNASTKQNAEIAAMREEAAADRKAMKELAEAVAKLANK